MSVTKSKRNFFLSKGTLWNIAFFIALSAILYFSLWSSGSEDVTMTERVLIVLVFDGFVGCLFLVVPLTYYALIGKLINDKSERSIIPLFDKGYSTLHGNFRNIFKEKYLKGTCSGLPLTVTIEEAVSLDARPIVRFTLYPLAHRFHGRGIEKSIEFKMDLRNKLKGDIKPEVLKFAEDLKSKGYVADDEAA